MSQLKMGKIANGQSRCHIKSTKLMSVMPRLRDPGVWEGEERESGDPETLCSGFMFWREQRCQTSQNGLLGWDLTLRAEGNLKLVLRVDCGIYDPCRCSLDVPG